MRQDVWHYVSMGMALPTVKNLCCQFTYRQEALLLTALCFLPSFANKILYEFSFFRSPELP
jgi:hypothetical protein